MIETLRRLLLDVRFPYRTPFDRERSAGLLAVNLLLMVLWLLILVAVIIPNIVLSGGAVTANTIYASLFGLPLIAVYFFVQTGRLETGVRIFLAIMMSVTLPILTSLEVPVMPVMLLLPVAAGMALLPRRRQIRLILVVIVILGVRLYLQSQYTRTLRLTPSDTFLTDLILFGVSFGLGSVLLIIAGGASARLQARTGRATTLLRAVGGYRALVAGIYDDDRVFIRALELLQIDLRYTLASAYRLNEAGSFTRLRLGGIGQDISRSEIRLNEDVTAVGEAARRTQALIASAFESGTLGAHILPPARWSISLPIIRDGVLLGVIDVQTQRADGFDEDEREAFGILVDQIAGALVEARDFRELQRINREQDELLLRYRSQLVQSEQRGQQMFVSAWDRYIQGRTATGEAAGFGFDLAVQSDRGTAITPASDLPPDIQEALASGDVHVEQVKDAQIVRAPVSFRNQTLGALSFRIPKGRPLTDRQLALLRTVATRLGVALENNRLFEQSQAQALRERKVGEIGNVLITATDIDSVLNLAALNFNEALGAVATRVILEPSRFAEFEREYGLSNNAQELPDEPFDTQSSSTRSSNGHSNGAHANGNGHDPDRNGNRQ